MPGDSAKVKRYYRRFNKATEELNDYLEDVGESLADGGYVSQASDFLEQLESKTDAREAARIQLERVIREERVGIGPITVENRTTVSYAGKYLWDVFKDDPETRDELIEVVYKVKTPKFNQLVKEGRLKPKDVDKAIEARKQTVALKGLPGKIGLG